MYVTRVVIRLGSFCFFKQKTAYDMRISSWSSDVCSSDLTRYLLTLLSQICCRYHLMVQRGAWSNSSNAAPHRHTSSLQSLRSHSQNSIVFGTALHPRARDRTSSIPPAFHIGGRTKIGALTAGSGYSRRSAHRSEEHTSAPVTNAHLVCRLLLEKNKTNQ